MKALRVGIPIPTDPPNMGGGYEFQSSIFNAIRRRIESCSDISSIQWIPLATDSSSASLWNLDPKIVLSAAPSSHDLDRLNWRRRLARLRRPWNPLSDWHSEVSNLIGQCLSPSIDVLWSLNPFPITDQLPFIVPIWDLQHRLQPFFPEVSSSGQWESRDSHYKSVTGKAFLSLTGTQRGADELTHFYNVHPERVLVNPFPCPEPLPRNVVDIHDILKQFHLPARQFLLYPAQFWPHKNHITILRAIKALQQQGISLKVVFTGVNRGSLLQVQHAIQHLDLVDSVVLTGFLDRPQLIALYYSALALVYPSFFGPDNIPPLEAMSYGLPCVVASVPGAKQQLGVSALFFNPESASELAEQIHTLVNNSSLRASLINSGYALVSLLTPDRYVDRVSEYLLSSVTALQCARSSYG